MLLILSSLFIFKCCIAMDNSTNSAYPKIQVCSPHDIYQTAENEFNSMLSEKMQNWVTSLNIKNQSVKRHILKHIFYLNEYDNPKIFTNKPCFCSSANSELENSLKWLILQDTKPPTHGYYMLKWMVLNEIFIRLGMRIRQGDDKEIVIYEFSNKPLKFHEKIAMEMLSGERIEIEHPRDEEVLKDLDSFIKALGNNLNFTYTRKPGNFCIEVGRRFRGD